MRARSAFRENPFLVRFRQANVAVAATMDMHEHCPSDEKRVVVDSRVLLFGHIGQVENSFSQFLMKFFCRFQFDCLDSHFIFSEPFFFQIVHVEPVMHHSVTRNELLDVVFHVLLEFQR